MAEIRMVRKPSDTPNITNIDDIIAMRYVYGNQSGFIKGKGAELSYTVNGLTFIVNSGRFVVQGVEADIDSNGATITIDNVSSTRYFIVYAKINLGLNKVEVLATYDTLNYPTLPKSDDLTVNTNGIAYLELYRFTSSGSSISNIFKTVKPLGYYTFKRVLLSELKEIKENSTLVLSGDYSHKELEVKVRHYTAQDAEQYWERVFIVGFGNGNQVSTVLYEYQTYRLNVAFHKGSDQYSQGIYAVAVGSDLPTYIVEISERF